MAFLTPTLSDDQLGAAQVTELDLQDSSPCVDVDSNAYGVTRIDCHVNWKDVRWNTSAGVYRVLIDKEEMASGKTKKMYRVSRLLCLQWGLS